jgi:hypothetical protein
MGRGDRSTQELFYGKPHFGNVIVKNNFSQISPSASEDSTESRACGNPVGSTVIKMNVRRLFA